MFLMELARNAADSAGVDDMTHTFAQLSHLVVISFGKLSFMLHLFDIHCLSYTLTIPGYHDLGKCHNRDETDCC